MSVQDHCKSAQAKDVMATDAFFVADTAWPFESWDDAEWARVVKLAVKEIKKGGTTPVHY